MSRYTEIGITRQDRYGERILSRKEMLIIKELESQKNTIWNQIDALYDNDDINDEELKTLEKVLLAKSDILTDKICEIKFYDRRK